MRYSLFITVEGQSALGVLHKRGLWQFIYLAIVY